MYEGAAVGVVIPAYNEAGFISDVIDTVPEFVDKVIVVDDCSTDGTWTEIKQHVATSEATEATSEAGQVVATDGSGMAISSGDSFLDRRLVPVRHETNRGRGGAVKTGYRLAVMAGMDVIAVMDGDGQMDPDDLDRIVEPVAAGRADYAKGNRLVSRDHCSEMSGWRLFGNVLLTLLTKIASGHWSIRDPQNGYTAISAEALEAISVSELYEDYGFLNDLLIRLGARDLRVVDVPMEAIYGDESSGIEYSSFVPGLSMLLLRGFLWRLRTSLGSGRRAGD